MPYKTVQFKSALDARSCRSFLSGVGGTLVFCCSYNLKYLNLSAKLPTFYKEVIWHWQELNKVVPTTKKDVLDQIVWNN